MTLRPRSAVLLAILLCLTTACPKDDVLPPPPPPEPTEPPPPALREGATEFSIDVPGTPEEPEEGLVAVAGVCLWTFDVAVIPDGATSVQLVSCVVEFKTSVDGGNRANASLRAPDGESEALKLVSARDKIFRAEVLLGEAVVNGTWRARLAADIPCDSYTGATLSLHGDYFTDE
ncbi:MAG: hypothetical protein ACYTCU_06695 [Planctomycetota bacterium]|jgi:hypothetical protein